MVCFCLWPDRLVQPARGLTIRKSIWPQIYSTFSNVSFINRKDVILVSLCLSPLSFFFFSSGFRKRWEGRELIIPTKIKLFKSACETSFLKSFFLRQKDQKTIRHNMTIYWYDLNSESAFFSRKNTPKGEHEGLIFHRCVKPKGSACLIHLDRSTKSQLIVWLFPGFHCFLSGNSHGHIHNSKLEKMTQNSHNVWRAQRWPSCEGGRETCQSTFFVDEKKFTDNCKIRCLAPYLAMEPVFNSLLSNFFSAKELLLIIISKIVTVTFSNYFSLHISNWKILALTAQLLPSCYLEIYQISFRSISEDQD